MVNVEVLLLSETAIHADSGCFHFQLVTGEIPYTKHPDDFIVTVQRPERFAGDVSIYHQ